MYRKYPADADSPEDFFQIKVPEVDADYELDIILLNKADEPIGGYRSSISMKGSDISAASRVTFKTMEMIPHPETDDEKARMLLQLNNETYTKPLAPVIS